MANQTAYIPVNTNPPPYSQGVYKDTTQVLNNPVAPSSAPGQHTVVIVTQPEPVPQHHGGGGMGPIVARCPKCEIGMVRLNFTLLGWLWAIFCFPCGLFCLFGLRDKRCSNCGYDMNYVK